MGDAGSFDWNEKQQQGLGYALLNEIESCCQKLSENPQHYTLINERFRRIRISRFPYLLIYEISDSHVIINSIFHVKREPK